MSKKKESENTYTQITGTVGGISIAIIVILGIFASQQMWVAIPVVGLLVLLGIVLGYFKYKNS